ncbi:MAG: hypothetical protein CW691_05015 [Candidatus Bathyarchaeum sp.]|nr:MAG: hypothetical protein CW691_05015 [Candidatus Bathyarchaeum sp.]
MLTTNAFFALFFFGSSFGLLFVLVGYFTYHLGKKKTVNSFIGVKIPPTIRNQDVWMNVNMRIGLLMILHGIFLVIFSVILPLMYNPFLLLASLFLPLAIYLPYGIWYAYHLESQYTQTSQTNNTQAIKQTA